MTNPFLYICPLFGFTAGKRKSNDVDRNQPLEISCRTAAECRRGSHVHTDELRVQGWTPSLQAGQLTIHRCYWTMGLYPVLCRSLPSPRQGSDNVCDLWATIQMPNCRQAQHTHGDTIMQKILTLKWSRTNFRAAGRARIVVLAWVSQCDWKIGSLLLSVGTMIWDGGEWSLNSSSLGGWQITSSRERQGRSLHLEVERWHQLWVSPGPLLAVRSQNYLPHGPDDITPSESLAFQCFFSYFFIPPQWVERETWLCHPTSLFIEASRWAKWSWAVYLQLLPVMKSTQRPLSEA